MKPIPDQSSALRLTLSISALAAVMSVCLAAHGAKPAAAAPNVLAASGASSGRVSPYTLANRRALAAAASASAAPSSLPPSMRHGRQGWNRLSVKGGSA